MTDRISLGKIRPSADTQARVELNHDVALDYADAYRSGASLPEVVLFFDGTDYWVGDGAHRIHGRFLADFCDIEANVRPGTQRDAILYATGTNATHGLRRTNADKRRAVELMLLDLEWQKWSNRQIAVHCGVSLDLVNRVRDEMESTERIVQSPYRTGLDGRTYDTENIGHLCNAQVTPNGSDDSSMQDSEPETPDEPPPLLCHRCQRVGACKDCPDCANLSLQRGDMGSGGGSGSCGGSRSSTTPSGQGEGIFPWSQFNSHWGGLQKLITLLGENCHCAHTPDASALHRLLDEWKDQFRSWYQTVARKKAPRED